METGYSLPGSSELSSQDFTVELTAQSHNHAAKGNVKSHSKKGGPS